MKEAPKASLDAGQLLPLLKKLFSASPGKQQRILRKHPELLSGEVRSLLEDLARFARTSGDEEVARVLGQMRSALDGLRGDRAIRVPPDQEPPPGAAEVPVELHAMVNRAVEAMRRYQRVGSLPLLEEGLAAWESVVAHPRFSAGSLPFRLNALNDLAVSHLFHYRASGDPADLTTAAGYLERAISATPKDSPALPDRLTNLGGILSNRYDLEGRIADLEQAVGLYRQAIHHAPARSPSIAIALNSMGVALLKRYHRSGDLKDLEESINAFESALQAAQKAEKPASSPAPDNTLILTNLGNALRARYGRTSELPDLERACASLEDALSLKPSTAADRSILLNNLASGLQDLYEQTHDEAHLLRVIELFEEALRSTNPESPLHTRCMAGLAVALVSRFDHSRNAADLERALSLDRKAMSCVEKGSPSWAEYRLRLGGHLARRYKLTRSTTDYREALTTLREASEAGRHSNLECALDSARSWADLAFLEGDWAEAAQGYEAAHGLSQLLMEIHVARGHRELWLRETQNLGDRSAYALARIGDLDRAVVALERNHARLLDTALGRSHVSMERLKASDAPSHNRLREAADRWCDLASAPLEPGPRGHALRAAERSMDDAVKEIQELPGFQGFLAPPDFDSVRQATGVEPLVYLAVTAAGGLGLILTSGAQVKPVWLPELTYDALVAHMFGGEGEDDFDLTRYMSSYLLWRRDPSHAEWTRLWFEALEATTHWLWQVLIGPLLEALPPAAGAFIVPAGVLASLPLHAAWTEDSTTPTGRRYALDRLVFAVAPNARSLVAAREIKAHEPFQEEVLVVSDPRPTASPLPFAAIEGRAVRARFQNGRIVEREDATREAVKSAMQEYSVIHFACHAWADMFSPLRSGLLMAHSEMLSLADILGLRHKDRRLTILSACETSMPGFQLPDEVVSLSTGLLGVGGAGVIASLWSVADLSTAMLMARFYDFWRRGGKQPPEALRDAQVWLRDTTNQEKETFFSKYAKETEDIKGATQAILDALQRSPADERSFCHPFYWAAFSYSGV